MRTFVIAEAGVNHNGSLDRAKALVDVAREAGADAVKFQTFKAASLIARSAPKAAYQDRNVGTGETQLEMVRKLELGDEAHRALAAHCHDVGVEFMSTPFGVTELSFLVSMGVARIKLSSGDLTHVPLLRAAGATGLPVVLSTGMATLGDVEAALGALASGMLGGGSVASAYFGAEGRAALSARTTLLHCTTEYPAPLGDVNLRAIQTLRQAFGLPVGYSDHTEGVAVSIAAVALGASVIEKHFTLDRSLPGPDHKASLEPAELSALVAGVRAVELALGDGQKVPTASELVNLRPARRSLVAARAIAAGERFTTENLSVKRPGDGVSAVRFDDWLGRVAHRAYQVDDLIEEA